jgi:hypothetical protein
MAKQFNSAKLTFFVLDGNTAARNGSVSFRTYTDKVGALADLYPELAKKGLLSVGCMVQYVEGTDAQGRPRGKYFELSQSHRTFQVRDEQRDVNGILMSDFLRCSPFCEGSPNLLSGKALYRELNTAADAQVALDAGRVRAKATAKVYELIDAQDWSTISDLAAYIGIYNEPVEVKGHRVAEWAEKRPVDFFEIFNSGDRSIRALVRRAISESILHTKGSVVHWEDTIIGADEDKAVAYLVNNPQMLEALRERFEKKTESPKKKK